jgi:hypothetical protein
VRVDAFLQLVPDRPQVQMRCMVGAPASSRSVTRAAATTRCYRPWINDAPISRSVNPSTRLSCVTPMIRVSVLFHDYRTRRSNASDGNLEDRYERPRDERFLIVSGRLEAEGDPPQQAQHDAARDEPPTTDAGPVATTNQLTHPDRQITPNSTHGARCADWARRRAPTWAVPRLTRR